MNTPPDGGPKASFSASAGSSVSAAARATGERSNGTSSASPTVSPATRSTDPRLMRERVVTCVRAVGVALRVVSVLALAAFVGFGVAGLVVDAVLVARDSIAWWMAAVPWAVWAAVATWVVARLWRMANAMRATQTFADEVVVALNVDWARERVYHALSVVVPRNGGRRIGPVRTIRAWYRATRLPFDALDTVRASPLLQLFAPAPLRRTARMAMLWAALSVIAPLTTLALAALL